MSRHRLLLVAAVALALVLTLALLVAPSIDEPFAADSPRAPSGHVSQFTIKGRQGANPLDSEEGKERVALTREPIEGGTFTASGKLVVHALSAKAVRVLWSGPSGELGVEASAGDSSWSGVFPPGSYRLTAGWIDGIECEIDSEGQVAPGSSVSDIRLIQAGCCLIELVDARDGASVSDAFIQPSEMRSADVAAPRRVNRFRTADGVRTEIRIAGAGPDSPFSVQYTGAAVLLPPWAQESELHIAATGYRDRVLEPLGRDGHHFVALERLRHLYVELPEDPDGNPRFDVEVRFRGGGPIETFDRMAPGASLATACPDSIDSVELVVRASATATAQVSRSENVVSLNEVGDTYYTIDAADLDPEARGAVLAATVSTRSAVDGIRSWQMSIIPVRASEAEPSAARTVHSALSDWDCLSPHRSYTKEFDGLRPGLYDLVISPIGHVRRVALTDGQFLEEHLEIPPLAELRLWPVDSDGQQIADVASLGCHVYWYWADVEPDPGREQSANRFDQEDGSLGKAILRGVVQFAPMSDEGNWLLRAPAGREINVEVLAPEALEAQPLTLRLEPGSMDATIHFNGH